MSGPVADEDADAPSLPALVSGAARRLAGAVSAADVLAARDEAALVYDIAKRMSRFAKAKDAHDVLVATARRAMADALAIEVAAKMRLADEYDAAKKRGEAATGRPKSVGDGDTFQSRLADVGLSRQQVHEARQIRAAEAADPGFARRVLDERLAAGQEPTKAAIRQAIAGNDKPEPQSEPPHFEREGRIELQEALLEALSARHAGGGQMGDRRGQEENPRRGRYRRTRLCDRSPLIGQWRAQGAVC